MKAELGEQFRIAGLARSPDREGALAHLDPDRGFALVARGSTGPSDVVDPTIWVKEKVSLALSASGDPADPPLRRIIGAIRALHGELMARPESERPWVAVMTLLLLGEDAVAVSAGDCPCLRFRSGLLSRLGRTEADLGTRAPRGALGSEPQVRIEVVPLRPRPGDLYILSTRALREGELAVLSRDLTLARGATELLRAGAQGASDRGRVAIRVLEAAESDAIVTSVDSPWTGLDGFAPESGSEIAVDGGEDLGDWSDAMGAEGPGPGADVLSAADEGSVTGAGPAAEREFEAGPLGVPGLGLDADDWGPESELPAEPPAAARAASSSTMPAPGSPASPAPRARAALAPVEEDRPWYEPLALWAGGALAIVALALLLRALLPGILGSNRVREPGVPAIATATGLADIFSDPPGASVRVDGVQLEGKTPLNAVALQAGFHSIELDWGVYGTWRDSVEIAPGSRLTVHPALFGAVTFRASEPSRVLDVYLDGVYAGTTPLTLDRVVVGRHLVRFGGSGLATSAREVEVLRDQPVEVLGYAASAPEMGSLTVRTAVLGETGFEPGSGDPIWVDGVAKGRTPATFELAPGTHSVRVARRGFPHQISILDVKAGGEHFITGEFGARSEEPLRFDAPESLPLSEPTPLTIALPSSEWEPSMSLWLYAAPPGGSFQAKRMTRIEEGSRTFAALLPPEVLRNSSRRVRFYFKATGAAGREIYSEIYTVPLRD